MRSYDLIQVLWVENDPKVIETYPMMAEEIGLELVHFPCWDDAKKALDNEFDRWSAIILDAKCRYHRNSDDNAVVFLREALKDISKLSEIKHRIIPWYVLTGGAEHEVSDSINDERLQWDSDWKEKKYYSKLVDTEMLFRRIKVHASYSPSIQIHEVYKNVFNAVEECGLDDKVYTSLEDLLIPIHYPDLIEDKDYNDKYVKAREVLEYLFRSMSSNGLLPEWGKKVNFVWSSCILCGKPATTPKGDIVYNSNKRVLPEAMAKIIKAIVNVIPPFCHSEADVQDGISRKDYMNSVDFSTFLLKSFSLQLCDLILCYRNYLREHPKSELNALGWDKVER